VKHRNVLDIDGGSAQLPVRCRQRH